MSTVEPDDRLLRRLAEVRLRFAELDEQLADPAVFEDPARLRDLGQERAALEPAVREGTRLEGLLEELAGAREMAESTDGEMQELALEETRDLERRIEPLVEQVRELLLPRDPMDDRPAVVEIRAGTGGDEAGLFASDLLRLYTRYAERRGWKVELLTLSEGIPGAVKEAVLTVSGQGAFGALRYESGVHRVQRVPETESQGRIHTSAATVAVLPEAEEVDVAIDPGELRIDVFRSSGPGGQSVNTTDSAVRITHLPTGLVVSCQDEKSQHKNKAKAMKVLRSRLFDRALAERDAERAAERRSQVGSGDRSAKIRTYNFPQSRVTDHRIGLSVFNLDAVMDGDLDGFVRALRLAAQEERMEAEG
ncbi:peptide chain release factor 1 [Gemmatimonadota bacterium DH-20]|uniref:Peptide chain release factor 1 n=1 Tax=Gaopeijia maritima TaxID=3119007 RepID=A0ABU9EBN9_9BACT